MSVFLGSLLIFWGALILYVSLFKMKQVDYRDKVL